MWNSYNSRFHAAHSAHKTSNNRMLARIIKKHIPTAVRSQKKMLLLDDCNFGTTDVMRLSRAFSCRDQIIIPQFDRQQYDLMHKSKKAQVLFGTAESFLIKPENLQGIISFFLDYEGTSTGSRSKDLFPLEDITLILSKTEEEKLIMAHSFTLRTHLGKYDNRANMKEQIWEDFLTPLFMQFQFIAEILFSHQYRNAGSSNDMWFVIYKLCRDRQLPVVNPDYAVFTDRQNHITQYVGYRTFPPDITEETSPPLAPCFRARLIGKKIRKLGKSRQRSRRF